MNSATASVRCRLFLGASVPLLSMMVVFSAHAKVPAVVAGPDLTEHAQSIEAPIAAVTVFSDRARIERRARPRLAVGVQTVRLPDLPGSTFLDTLRLEARGARVLRVEATPVLRARRAIDQVEDLLDAIESLKRTMARHAAQRVVLADEVQLLNALNPTAPAPEGKRRRAPKIDPSAWTRARSFLSARRSARYADLAASDLKATKMSKALVKLQAELAHFGQGAFSERRTIQVVAILEATSNISALSLVYFVPGASWRPRYTVALSKGGRALTVRTAARVQQATGEDWPDVKLALSTALPGRGIEAPELLTWTLGEAKDFEPKPREAAPRRPVVLAPPQPTRTLAEKVKAEHFAALGARMSQATQAPPGAVGVRLSGGGGGYGIGGVVGQGHGRLGRGREIKRPARSRRPRIKRKTAAPQAPPMPVALSMDLMMGLDEAASESMPGSPVNTRGGSQAQRTPLDLFEAAPLRRPKPNDPTLPAVMAGGLDYVYRSATKVSVPSSPEAHNVPLSSARYPVETYYEITPGVRLTAFLKAKVKNQGKLPILGGPVDIFSSSNYVGSGVLETTGVGGDLELPLGADEDVEVVRRLIPKTVTEGVFKKHEITHYRTEIDVVNHKRRPIEVRLLEQYPLTDVEDIGIKSRGTTPKPVTGPDARGLMTFVLKIPAGQKRSVQLDYKIKRPANWRLWQR